MRWIIGDIHGMLTPLEALLRAIEATDPECEFLFVGDYINRGPDSAAVVELILALPDARFIRGNHDDIFDLVINGESAFRHQNAQDPVAAARWFMEHGLDRTLLSYGASEAAIADFMLQSSLPLLRQLTQSVPEAHRRFFRQLPLAIDEPDFFIVHGSWPIDEPTDQPGVSMRLAQRKPLRQAALWGRFNDDEFGRKKAWNRTGIFGHTPCSNYAAGARTGGAEPIQGPNVILIDTAVALNEQGRLTAYCADSNTFMQADHFGQLVDD